MKMRNAMDPGFIRRGSRISRKMGSKGGSKSGDFGVQKRGFMGCQGLGGGPGDQVISYIKGNGVRKTLFDGSKPSPR